MTEQIRPLIARAIRSISNQLNVLSSDPPLPVNNLSAISTPTALHTPPTEFRLDAPVAETLQDGSLMFPDPGNDSEPDWCVLTLSSIDTLTGEQKFQLAGRLAAGVEPEQFVQGAYRLIFMRSADEDGMTIYSNIIANHQLARRDVLRILVESDEAKTLNRKFLIIPQPSSWLSSLRIDKTHDADFPILIVQPVG